MSLYNQGYKVVDGCGLRNVRSAAIGPPAGEAPASKLLRFPTKYPQLGTVGKQ